MKSSEEKKKRGKERKNINKKKKGNLPAREYNDRHPRGTQNGSRPDAVASPAYKT